MNTMRITRLRISNYRGIATLDHEVPPGGIVAKGANGRGKTSILKAIRAALAAQDIDADAIRNGADKAEILIDLDAIQVRRSITKKGGGGLTVTHDFGEGVRGAIGSPQTYLTNLLGTAPLDPLDLFLAKADKRRTKILAALPVTVTVEQLRKWAPDLPASTDVSGHGLEVLARVRKAYYDARTEANAKVKAAKAEADQRKAQADELSAKWSGPSIPLSQAEELHARATSELAAIEARTDEALRSRERTRKSRERVIDLRDNAAHEVDGMTAPEQATITEAARLVVETKEEIGALERKLASARERLSNQEFGLLQLTTRAAAVKAAHDRAASLRAQADELDATIAEASVTAPSDEEFAVAERAVNQAAAAVDDARRAALAVEARTIADTAAATVLEAAKRADALDDIVVALTNDAPAALLAGSNGIPGLTLDGDDILLDGVSLDGLSGAEQLEFAVEVARRANAKSKILVVDGLERLDPDQYDAFVRSATAGDYQLIASRVDRGDVVLEAIEPRADAAEQRGPSHEEIASQ